MQRFLTVPEVDQLLPISPAALYKEIRTGYLACLKIGGKYVVPSAVVDVLVGRASGDDPTPLPTESTSPTGKPFLGITQAAKLLRVSTFVLGREIREGRFPHVTFGGRSLVPCRVIDDLEREAMESMSLVDVADFTAAANWKVAS